MLQLLIDSLVESVFQFQKLIGGCLLQSLKVRSILVHRNRLLGLLLLAEIKSPLVQLIHVVTLKINIRIKSSILEFLRSLPGYSKVKQLRVPFLCHRTILLHHSHISSFLISLEGLLLHLHREL